MFNNRVSADSRSPHRITTVRRVLPLSVAALLALASGCRDTSTEKVETSAPELAGSAVATLPLNLSQISVAAESGEAQFSGLPVGGQAGQPELPFRMVKLLVPPGTDLAQLVVRIDGASERLLPGSFRVRPTKPPTANGEPMWPAGVKIVDGKDMAVYGTNAFFPASRLGSVKTGQLDRYRIVEVPVFPFRYNPQTGELRQLLGGQVTVSTPSGVTVGSSQLANASSAVLDASYAERVQGIVDNYDQVIESYSPPVLAQGASALFATAGATQRGYAIVTTEAIKAASSNLGRFADSKAANGFAVTLVTGTGEYTRSGSTWACAANCGNGWGGGTGDAAANAIRQWLIDNRASHNLSHVLLVGNPHPKEGDVPMKMAWPTWRETEYREKPTDFYYAELTGSWDANGDGFYGQYEDYQTPGGPDTHAELSVGRIPFYGEPNDLDHIFAKIYAYEHTRDVAWRRKALLPMRRLADDSLSYPLGESIKTNVLVPNSWGYFRVYDQDYGLTPEFTPVSPNNVRSAWLSAQPGAVVWQAHGSPLDADTLMNVDNAMRLDDAHPAFVYEASCNNATPEEPNNLAYTLLRNGAIGTVAATRVSYGAADTGHVDTNYNDNSPAIGTIGRNFIGQVVSGASAGDALNQARQNINMPFDSSWANAIEFNLYGDPSLSIGSSGTGAIVPAAPTGLTVTASNAQVELKWAAVPDASRFIVRRATTAGGPYTVLNDWVTSRNYVDKTGDIGTQYYYSVSGVNIAGEGTRSADQAATRTPLVRVLFRTGDTNAKDNLIKPWFQIVNISNTMISLKGYTVQYWFTSDGTAPQTYTCDWATGSCSGVTAQLSPTLVPGADTVLSLSFGNLALIAGQTLEVQGHISKSDNSNYDETNDYSYSSQTNYMASTRTPAVVNDQAVWGVRPRYLSDQATFPTAISRDGQVTLSWGPVPDASSYNIYRSTSGSTATLIGNTEGLSFVDGGRTNGTLYSYYIKGVLFGEVGFPSDTVSTRPFVPSTVAPSGVAATVGSGSAVINWNAVPGATSYNLKLATTSGGPYMTVASGITGTSQELAGLTNGTTYYFVISAWSSAGEGPNSSQLSVTPAALPPAVTGVSATAGNAQVTLKWAAASGATSYTIKRANSIQGPFTAVGTSKTTPYVARGLTNGTTYYFTVSGVNAAGEGPASTKVSAVPHS